MIYVDRDHMEKDKLFPKTKCFSAIVKLDMRILDGTFFSMAKDTECNTALYETNIRFRYNESELQFSI